MTRISYQLAYQSILHHWYVNNKQPRQAEKQVPHYLALLFYFALYRLLLRLLLQLQACIAARVYGLLLFDDMFACMCAPRFNEGHCNIPVHHSALEKKMYHNLNTQFHSSRSFVTLVSDSYINLYVFCLVTFMSCL